jgi:hypothetical protein
MNMKKVKKQVSETKNRSMKAAHHMGKSHALAREGYNCRYDEGTEEARMYHEGYKMGLDECYGIMPNRGVVDEESETDIVDDMASFGAEMYEELDDMHDMAEGEMEEGNAFTAALAKTPKGGKFTVGGKTFTDTSNLEEENMFTFESLDKQLNQLLNESDENVNEGVSVSINKGREGMPDSVTVSAEDEQAQELLGFLKTMNAGLFNEKPEASDYGSPEVDHSGIKVVGDHDGMMGLMKKMSDIEQHTHSDPATHSDDYAEEEPTCEQCQMKECQCESEEMLEDETTDQREFEVAEDNMPDSDAQETTADEEAEAEEDKALAMKSISEESGQELQQILKMYPEQVEMFKQGGPLESDLAEALWEYYFEKGLIKNYDNDATDKISSLLADELGLTESYANQIDDAFIADSDFMINDISSGLNKRKATGQTTVPVIPGQKDRMGYSATNESIGDWLVLAGIKK